MELAAEAGRLADAAPRRAAARRRGRRPATPTTLEMAEALAGFHFPDDVWARVIYDLVIAAATGDRSLATLVAALVPIYFGRVGQLRHREPAR